VPKWEGDRQRDAGLGWDAGVWREDEAERVQGRTFHRIIEQFGLEGTFRGGLVHFCHCISAGNALAFRANGKPPAPVVERQGHPLPCQCLQTQRVQGGEGA